MALPTGIVTFLFTDVEGSTKLWERRPDAMRVALAEHDAIMRAAVARHRGVTFKTVGDAFCCAFSLPRDALDAAVEAQRSLGSYAWPEAIGEMRVRMAIHTGECAEREGDYFGPTVNRVARLMAVAHGQQILVSSATAALLREGLGEGMDLRDLGPSRLKDLSRTESAFQVIAEGLRANFPALATLDSRPNNLPSQLSSFVGRRAELGALHEAIGAARLLTIVGPGGIGKTRIALQLAANVLDRYGDGTWFADLTATGAPGFVAQSVASALGVRELPNEPIERTLTAYLHDKNVLLVLDNAEHVLGGVASLVKALLERSPAVTVLTTSREPLHLAGEHVYRLGPLEAPGGEGSAALGRHDSTRLFLERAREAAPSMQFGDEESADVAALCDRLEGIPLAIELACARLSSMPLQQLLRRLTSGLALASKDATESARHRTLRDTIAWSVALLDAGERRLLAMLSVFSGGAAIEAIESVAGEAPGAEEAVDALVDKSLLQADSDGGDARYRLLDVVRQFASERLAESGDAQDVARRHCAYYARLARGAYAAVDADLPNLRAALEWSVERDPAIAAAIAGSLAPYWRVRGFVSEARSWIARVLASIGDGPDRSALLCSAASFATMQDELAISLRFSNEALERYRSAGDDAGASQALFRIAEVLHRQGSLDRAESLYAEAREGFARAGDARGEMICLGNLGMLARQRGALHEAAELLEDALRRAHALADGRVAGEFAMAMAWVRLGLDDVAASQRLFEGAFAEKSSARDRYGVCSARHGLATIALKEGRLDDAFGEFVTTLREADELQLKDYVARALHGVAAVRAERGDVEAAARFLGLADRLFQESGRELRDSIAYEIAARAVEAAVVEPRRSALREEGAGLRVRDALAGLS